MRTLLIVLLLSCVCYGEVFTGTKKVSGSDVVIEGIDFDRQGKAIGAITVTNAQRVVIRDCDFHGFQKGPGSNNALVYISKSSHVLIENCRFYDNGSVSEEYERDIHGILIGPDASYITISNCVSWNNAGDSIQVSYYSAAPALPASNIRIVGNVFFSDGENAIDLKGCENVTIEDNVIRDYGGQSAGSDGTGIGVHYDKVPAKNVIIRGNDFRNCKDNGITLSGGVDGIEIDRNTFTACGTAINSWQIKKATITGNVLEDCPGGIKASTGTSLTLSNNVFGRDCKLAITPTSYYLAASMQPSNIFVGIDAEYGDVNLDGLIDMKDQTVLLENVFRAGGWRQGDINGDLVVDVLDFQILNSEIVR